MTRTFFSMVFSKAVAGTHRVAQMPKARWLNMRGVWLGRAGGHVDVMAPCIHVVIERGFMEEGEEGRKEEMAGVKDRPGRRLTLKSRERST